MGLLRINRFNDLSILTLSFNAIKYVALGLFMKKLLLLFGVVLSACADVPLNQNATTLINHHHARQQSATQTQKDSYYYLLGIGSKDEPLQAGKAYTDELQALLKQHASEEEILALNQQYPVHEVVIFDEGNDDNTGLFCQYQMSGSQNPHACFEGLLTQKFDISKNKTVHDRYATFLKNSPAIMQGDFHFSMHYPQYTILIKGQRLHFIHLLKTHHHSQVMQGLLDELSSLRAYLANANLLIDKILYANMIVNQIQTIVLYHTHNPTIKPTISPMTADELSFNTAITGEFMGVYYLFNHLDKDINTTLFYKKHKTINDVADVMSEQINMAKLPASEFATHYHDNKPTQKKLDPTNVIGKTLADVGEHDYRSYMVKVKSLDNLINIANHHINGVPLTNVFAPTLTGSLIESTHICLQNPMGGDDTATTKQDKKFECLNI